MNVEFKCSELRLQVVLLVKLLLLLPPLLLLVPPPPPSQLWLLSLLLRPCVRLLLTALRHLRLGLFQSSCGLFGQFGAVLGEMLPPVFQLSPQLHGIGLEDMVAGGQGGN